MTEMLTITHDFDNCNTYDNMRRRAKESGLRNGHKQSREKTAFKINEAWKRCFSGREEYGYAAI